MPRRLARAGSAGGLLLGVWLDLSGYENHRLARVVVVLMASLLVWASWPYLVSILRRGKRFSTRAPPDHEPAQGTPDGFDALLPWVDEGQLVMVLRHKTDDTQDRATVPVAWWCEVTSPGSTQPAKADDEHDEHRPVPQRIEVRFPRDFRGAPGLPLSPGHYKVRWFRHRFGQQTMRVVGQELMAERDFVLHPDGRTWIK